MPGKKIKLEKETCSDRIIYTPSHGTPKEMEVYNSRKCKGKKAEKDEHE